MACLPFTHLSERSVARSRLIELRRSERYIQMSCTLWCAPTDAPGGDSSMSTGSSCSDWPIGVGRTAWIFSIDYVVRPTIRSTSAAFPGLRGRSPSGTIGRFSTMPPVTTGRPFGSWNGPASLGIVRPPEAGQVRRSNRTVRADRAGSSSPCRSSGRTSRSPPWCPRRP